MNEKNQPCDGTRQRRRPRHEDGSLPDRTSSPIAAATGPTPPDFSWSNPLTWPASLQLSPVAVVLLGIFVTIYVNHFRHLASLQPTPYQLCQAEFDYAFPIDSVKQVKRLASQGSEHGVVANALLQLDHPDMTVFAATPFPADKVPSSPWPIPESLTWLQPHLPTNGESWWHSDDQGQLATASLGIPAILLGQMWPVYLVSAGNYVSDLLTKAKRRKNGAMSDDAIGSALLAKDMAGTLPFLAYYAVVSNDVKTFKEIVRQCELYREALRSEYLSHKGQWKHTTTSEDSSKEKAAAQITALGHAAYGLAQVRATISGWRPANATMLQEIIDLDGWVQEMVDFSIDTHAEDSDLWYGTFSKISGPALIAATIYRMATQYPRNFASGRYLHWADTKRKILLDRVTSDVPSLEQGKQPRIDLDVGASVLFLASAWRDCVCAGVCR